jgi:hypothetical protein
MSFMMMAWEAILLKLAEPNSTAAAEVPLQGLAYCMSSADSGLCSPPDPLDIWSKGKR